MFEDEKKENQEQNTVNIPVVEEKPVVQESSAEADVIQNPVKNQDEVVAERKEEDYLNEINRLQEEYKQYQKAKREALERQKKEEAAKAAALNQRKGLGSFPTILISVGAATMIFILIFCALAFFPSKDESFLSQIFSDVTIIQQNSTITGTPGTSTDIGGTTVNPGDNVNITVESDSIAAAVYAKVVNSVVGIEVTKVDGGKWNQTETTYSQGSGIVYSSDGTIVTNYHVIEAAVNKNTGKLNSSFNIYAYFDTKLTQFTKDVTLVGYDVASDIAVLKFNIKGVQPITVANSDEITIGEPVVAIGCPGGLDFMNSVSEGIVSGTNRAIAVSNTEMVYDLIQTTAAINPGNSGGALLNSRGELVGICAMKLSDINYEGMGFAISSNTVKKIVESIRKYGYYNKPVLGVTIDTTYSMAVAQSNGWPLGAAVTEVTEGSCADKAGIAKNDIITEINSKRIETFIDLRAALLSYSPGETILVEIYRIDDNKKIIVQVTLDAAQR
ncbi:MAG: trypsin-like peptidase domain-containing protein [Clostridia bacterium]|nr:trypsin-like peptidase domain-containing protein [Clostridia bacterium]